MQCITILFLLLNAKPEHNHNIAALLLSLTYILSHYEQLTNCHTGWPTQLL